MILHCDWCGNEVKDKLHGIIKKGQDLYVCKTCMDAIREFQALSSKPDTNSAMLQRAEDRMNGLRGKCDLRPIYKATMIHYFQFTEWIAERYNYIGGERCCWCAKQYDLKDTERYKNTGELWAYWWENCR